MLKLLSAVGGRKAQSLLQTMKKSQQVRVETDKKIEDMRLMIELYRHKKSPLRNLAKRLDGATGEYTILVLDDTAEVRDVLGEVLDYSKNIEGILVKSSQEALKVLESVKITLCLMDINLGGKSELDGMELVKIVRSKYPKVFNVGMTGYPNMYSAFEARLAGFDDFFLKPFLVGELYDVIYRFLRRADRWEGYYKNVAQQ